MYVQEVLRARARMQKCFCFAACRLKRTRNPFVRPTHRRKKERKKVGEDGLCGTAVRVIQGSTCLFLFLSQIGAITWRGWLFFFRFGLVWLPAGIDGRFEKKPWKNGARYRLRSRWSDTGGVPSLSVLMSGTEMYCRCFIVCGQYIPLSTFLGSVWFSHHPHSSTQLVHGRYELVEKENNPLILSWLDCIVPIQSRYTP